MPREMTVAQALGQLKIINARIEREQQVPFVATRQNGQMPGHRNAEEFSAQARAALQAINDLFRNYDAIKAAIIQSNAQTRVTIGGVTMTVAQAIERKTSIAARKAFVQRLAVQLAQAQGTADKNNQRVTQQAEQVAVSALGQRTDANAAEFDSIVTGSVRRNSMEVLDPANVAAYIRRAQEEIETFEAEVDLALTTSNVNTVISID